MDEENLTINSIVTRSPDQVSSELDGEAVVLNIKTGKYFNLNAVGSRIWTCIEQASSIEALVQVILDEYAIDRQKCEIDIINLIAKLNQAGLVTVENLPSENK